MCHAGRIVSDEVGERYAANLLTRCPAGGAGDCGGDTVLCEPEGAAPVRSRRVRDASFGGEPACGAE